MPTRSLRRLARAFARDARANIAVSSAVFLPVVCVLGAVAVDEGAIYAERRNMQGLTDLAAIAAASAPTQATQAALGLFRENGIPSVRDAADPPPSVPAPTARIEPGHYDNSGSVPVERRFSAGAEPVNSFRVTFTRTATQYFSSGFLPPPPLQTVATAHAPAEASFSVGSRLAALDEGVANAVLGALLGAKLSLSLMDYRALAAARIKVPDLLAWIDASHRIEAVTYSDLLRTDLSLADFLHALATLPGMDKGAVPALQALAAGTPRDRKLPLGDVFDLRNAVGNRPMAASSNGIAASAAVFDIVGAAAAVANRNRQVEVALGAGHPGIVGATLHLAIGEPTQSSPWLGTGEEGATVRTAQTRLLLDLALLGPGGTLGTSVRLPVYAEAARAEARLAGIRCQAGRVQPTSVAVDATPGLAELRIADLEPRALGDFRTAPRFDPATIVRTPLAAVSGSAQARMSDGPKTLLSFSEREIAAGETKQAQSSGFVVAPVASLLGSLELEVSVLGLGAGVPSALKNSLSRTLAGHAASADLVLASTLKVLGVALGQADVTVNGGACHRAVLVQ